MSWPLVNLGNVCKLVNGDRGKNYPSKGLLQTGGIPFINAGNLTDNHSIICSGQNYISEAQFNLLSSGKVELGDILFCLRGSLGKFAIVDNKISKGAVASSLVIVRANEQLAQRYLKHYLKSPLCNYQIQSFENGAAQPNLSASDLKKFAIPLPPLEEQKHIAEILDRAEALKQKRQQALALVDEYLRATFLDLFGDPITNPKGWPVKQLKKLGKAITGSTPPSKLENMFNGDTPFITPGDLDGDLTSTKRTVTEAGKLQSRVCRAGSLVTCCIGATIGKVGIAKYESCFNQQINVLEWENSNLELYGYWAFKIKPQLIIENASHTTLPILKKSLFEEIQLPEPDNDKLIKFAQIVKKVESLKAKMQTSQTEIEHLAKSLSQKAFRGELTGN